MMCIFWLSTAVMFGMGLGILVIYLASPPNDNGGSWN